MNPKSSDQSVLLGCFFTFIAVVVALFFVNKCQQKNATAEEHALKPVVSKMYSARPISDRDANEKLKGPYLIIGKGLDGWGVSEGWMDRLAESERGSVSHYNSIIAFTSWREGGPDYKLQKSKSSSTVTTDVWKKTVKIYDARNGTLVAQEDFSASPPSRFEARPSAKSKTFFVEDGKIEYWIEETCNNYGIWR